MALKVEVTESTRAPTADAPGRSAPHRPPAPEGVQITSLARSAVEAFVAERLVIAYLPSEDSPLLDCPSACFVCIKTVGRELRGCIGTIEPEKKNLAEEVIANAIKAATRDPRFDPLTAGELPFMRYSVDVLGSPEPAVFEELDPSVYGVVVTDYSGRRRGLLLPALENIKTAGQQVSVAARKAGIEPGEPLKLYRFRTQRFSEWA